VRRSALAVHVMLDSLRNTTRGGIRGVRQGEGRRKRLEGGLEVPWLGRNWRITAADARFSGEPFLRPGGSLSGGKDGRRKRGGGLLVGAGAASNQARN
jgi:hypothetical protein